MVAWLIACQLCGLAACSTGASSVLPLSSDPVALKTSRAGCVFVREPRAGCSVCHILADASQIKLKYDIFEPRNPPMLGHPRRLLHGQACLAGTLTSRIAAGLSKER